MKYFVISIILFFTHIAFGQKTNIDSLVSVTESMKGDTLKAQNYLAIGKAFKIEKNDFENAILYAQKSIDLSNKIRYFPVTVRATMLLGQSYREKGQNTQAIQNFKNGLAIFESHKELLSDLFLCANNIAIYTAIADIYISQRDFENSEKNAMKALELSEKYNVERGKCWMVLSSIFSNQKNFIEAKKYVIKAIDYFKNQSYSNDDLARAYAFLAQCYYNEEDYLTSIANYKLSYETYKKVSNVYGIRIALYNLAQLYVKINNVDIAERYIAEIYTYTTVSKDAIFLSYINKLKFNILLTKKKYTEALSVGNEILDYAKRENNINSIKDAYEKFYLVYIETKDTSNAFIMIEKISVLKDSIYNIGLAKNTAELVKKYETEKNEQQISFLDKENKLNKERLDKETQLRQLLKSENLLKESKLQQEFLLKEALERENKLQDIELTQKQTIQQGLEGENKLKNTELNKETQLNKTLQTQNSLMLENSKNDMRVRWLMIAALLGFTAFGVNYYRSYKRQKFDNLQIVKQANDLKVLMKEVHHRVKNNLQLVVAMLRMQHRAIEDKAAIEALVNSENRLHAIAVVHEKLYKSENVSSVLLKDFLQELIDVFAKQYYNASKPVQFKILDNTNISTTLDTAIPIGLIVNELVTNSLKHAFTNLEQGQINLEISRIDNKYQLSIKDNGKGLPNGKLGENPKSLGLRLVKLFAEQLDGTLQYSNNNGACFTILFA